MYEVRYIYCDFMNVAHKPAQSNGCDPVQKRMDTPVLHLFKLCCIPQDNVSNPQAVA
jgi:hypothetical protein